MMYELYLASPRLVQNAALSLYGVKVYRDRFSGGVPPNYLDIGTQFSEPSAAQFKRQQDRLQTLLYHCKKFVPAYQDVLSGVDVRDINADNLSQFFPKLSKTDVKANPTRYLSTNPRHRRSRIKLKTSGSSGTPMTVYSSPEARRINYRFYQSLLNEFKLEYRSRSTTIAGRKLFGGESKHLDRYDYFNNTQYLSAYDISKKTIGLYVQALNSWRPKFIDSYPSALLEICKLSEMSGEKWNFKPSVVLTSSETLTPGAREYLERYFDCVLVDHYGCTEMAVSAFSKGGQYYSDPTYSVLEAEVRGDGTCSLITTGLLNLAMPLVRYEIGDLISTFRPLCPYIFNAVEGRVDDVIVTPEGTRIGRIGSAFKDISGIELIQVVQTDMQNVAIKIVLGGDGKSVFDEKKLVENFKNFTSNSINVTVSYCSDIERGPSGKIKTVVSCIPVS